MNSSNIEKQMTDDAMMFSRFRSTPEKIPFTIHQLIPASTVGAITATGGVGKSTFALQMCLQIALADVINVPFLNVFDIGKARKVLYISAEDSDMINHIRIHSGVTYIANREMIPDDLVWEELDKNFKHLDISGMPFTNLTEVSNGKISSTSTYDKLEEVINEFVPNLVIFDTKSRLSGVPENDNVMVAHEVAYFEKLVKPHGANLVIIHHTPKGNVMTARGASSFQDNLRWVINLSELKEVKGGILVTNSKQNYAPIFPQFMIRRVADYWFEVDGELQIGEPDVLSRVIDTLLQYENRPFTQEDLLELVYAANPSIARRQIRIAISQGLDDGALVNTGAGNKKQISAAAEESTN